MPSRRSASSSSRAFSLRFAAGTAATLLAGAAPVFAAPSFQGLGDLPSGAFASEARDVSADGSVVVGGGSPGASTLPEAMRWTEAGGMVGLGMIPPSTSLPSNSLGVSQDGAFVVGESSSVSFSTEAFRWDAGGGMVGLGVVPNGIFSSARAVSTDGSVVVGRSATAAGFVAFRWTAGGGMVSLGLLSGDEGSTATDVSADGSVVVGSSSDTASGGEAFRWTAATGMQSLGFLAGGYFSDANSVSADGAIVVGSTDDPVAGGSQAFRWTAASGLVGLGRIAGDSYAEALAVSADGSIVVGSSRAAGSRAFIWDATNGVRSLKDVLQAEDGLNLTGWTLTEATGVSADGRTIVGNGTNPNGDREAWIAKRGPVVQPDSDQDGQPDVSDNCPSFPNPTQADAGGVGIGSAPDGIGDACQCGDVSGDGVVTIADATIIRRAALVPPTATMAGPDRCDVNGSQSCSIADAVIIRRALLVPPTASIVQQCLPASH